MIKDLLFALELGFKVCITFIICIYLGIKLDSYFNTEGILILVMIILAFIIVIGTLLGVMKHE